MRRECRERFPRNHGPATPTCITARAWRTCCDAYRDRSLAVSFEVGGGESAPGIPGACATVNFMHLIRGPCSIFKMGRYITKARFTHSQHHTSQRVHIFRMSGDIPFATCLCWQPHHRWNRGKWKEIHLPLLTGISSHTLSNMWSLFQARIKVKLCPSKWPQLCMYMWEIKTHTRDHKT